MKQISQKWAKTNQSLSRKKYPKARDHSEATIQSVSNKKAKLVA